MPDKDPKVGLLSAINAYSDNSYGSYTEGGELARQRALALDAYQGKNIEPAPKGRSQVVDWSVFETVQWILPSLTRIFAAGDDVIEFDPVGPEDEDVAKQESEVLNHMVTSGNKWFLTCLTWFQDALITKNAYCLVQMEEHKRVEVERYEGQSGEQLQMLIEDGNEIVSAEERIDEDNPEPAIDPTTGQQLVDPLSGQPIFQPRVIFDVETKQIKEKQKLGFRVLPPENCIVDEDTPNFSLQEANYFEYFEDVTISDLRKMGFEVEDDIANEESGAHNSLESTARDDILGTDIADRFDSPDPSMRSVRLRRIWIRYDFDEDGVAELQKVMVVANKILTKDGEDAIEPATRIPVASIVPFLNTHRHVGMSVADLVFDIQRIKTTMLRSGLDSLYLANRPRHAASKKVNLNDLTVSVPGGVVQVDTTNPDVQGHVVPLQTENTFPFAQQGLEHMDRVIESRVGVNRIFQGIDESQLNDHNRIGQLSTMAAQRVEQIARLFAYGVEELFSIAHELVIKSGHSMEAIKLRNEWVNINPTQWKTGRDMRVVAPFAAGNKDSLLQRLMIIAGFHEKALTGGLPIVDASDAYELALEISKAADLMGTKFFTDPTTIPPQEPPPDYNMMQLEITNKEVENRAVNDEMDAANKRFEIEVEAEVKRQVAKLNSDTQIAIAALNEDKALNLEEFKAKLKNAPAIESNNLQEQANETVSALLKRFERLSEDVVELQQQVGAEKELVFDDKGRPIGSRVKK